MQTLVTLKGVCDFLKLASEHLHVWVPQFPSSMYYFNHEIVQKREFILTNQTCSQNTLIEHHNNTICTRKCNLIDKLKYLACCPTVYFQNYKYSFITDPLCILTILSLCCSHFNWCFAILQAMQCKICGRKYHSRSGLENHQTCCAKVLQYMCGVCVRACVCGCAYAYEQRNFTHITLGQL